MSRDSRRLELKPTLSGVTRQNGSAGTSCCQATIRNAHANELVLDVVGDGDAKAMTTVAAVEKGCPTQRSQHGPWDTTRDENGQREPYS